jgi:hypothetical protein
MTSDHSIRLELGQLVVAETELAVDVVVVLAEQR